MMVCPDCQRLRTPTGLHICLAAAKARFASIDPVSHRGNAEHHDSLLKPSKREDLRRIGTILLPGSDAVARIWNAVVEGNN